MGNLTGELLFILYELIIEFVEFGILLKHGHELIIGAIAFDFLGILRKGDDSC